MSQKSIIRKLGEVYKVFFCDDIQFVTVLYIFCSCTKVLNGFVISFIKEGSLRNLSRCLARMLRAG